MTENNDGILGIFQLDNTKGKEQENNTNVNVNNEHLHNVNNDINNEREQLTNEVVGQEEETPNHAAAAIAVAEEEKEEAENPPTLLDEADLVLDALLNPSKNKDKKEPPRSMKGIYFEDAVLKNLIRLQGKHGKGFQSSFVNEAVKKELVARGLWKNTK